MVVRIHRGQLQPYGAGARWSLVWSAFLTAAVQQFLPPARYAFVQQHQTRPQLPGRSLEQRFDLMLDLREPAVDVTPSHSGSAILCIHGLTLTEYLPKIKT